MFILQEIMDELVVKHNVLENFPDLLNDGLVRAYRNEGLIWTQKEVKPWWVKLDYASEKVARKDGEIEDENAVRDYRLITAKTDNFNIDFIQGPLSGRTSPQGFQERMEFVLNKPVLRGNTPDAFMFSKPDALGKEQLDYFNSPRFSLERHLGWPMPNVTMQSEGLIDDHAHFDRLHQLPQAEELIKRLISCSYHEFKLFTGKGVDDPLLSKQMIDFSNNLAAAYGFSKSNPDFSHIHMSRYRYGT